jgi:DNA polymerase-3 subunit alpha (Gram-positive type)
LTEPFGENIISFTPDSGEPMTGSAASRGQIYSYKQLLAEHRDFVVFDLETTGLSTKNGDRIIEIGAVRISDDLVVDRYSQLINPQCRLPRNIVDITNITDGMLLRQPTYEEVLPEFHRFIQKLPLVAHNASFDMRFLTHYSNVLRKPVNNVSIDTIPLLKDLYPDLPNYKLDTVHRFFAFDDFDHHRAVADAEVTAKIFIRIQEGYNLLGVGDLYVPESSVLTPDRLHSLRQRFLRDFDPE